MFHYPANTTRLAAAGCIALMLLSCLQQAHALCRLAGCTSHAATKCAKPCCQHARCCCQHTSQRTTESPNGRLAAHADASAHVPYCPASCPCVCCQSRPTAAPSPSVDADAALDVALANCSPLWAPSPTSCALDALRATPSSVAPQRAIDACVRLCRFLA